MQRGITVAYLKSNNANSSICFKQATFTSSDLTLVRIMAQRKNVHAKQKITYSYVARRVVKFNKFNNRIKLQFDEILNVSRGQQYFRGNCFKKPTLREKKGKKEKIVRKNIIIRGVSIRARNSFAHAQTGVTFGASTPGPLLRGEILIITFFIKELYS